MVVLTRPLAKYIWSGGLTRFPTIEIVTRLMATTSGSSSATGIRCVLWGDGSNIACHTDVCQPQIFQPFSLRVYAALRRSSSGYEIIGVNLFWVDRAPSRGTGAGDERQHRLVHQIQVLPAPGAGRHGYRIPCRRPHQRQY